MRVNRSARWVFLLQHAAFAVGIASLLSAVALRAQTPPAGPQVQQVIVGPNVNMNGGPASWVPGRNPELIGDPRLNRDNEPSIALSSRNPCHLMGGSNSYGLVDFEEDLGLEEADAWLNVYFSTNCGENWTSTPLVGHQLDFSAEGLASPLHGLSAAADPTVRAGTDGLFFYSGIAFDRGDGGIGKVFLARWVDDNNSDGGNPFRYLGTTEVDWGQPNKFLDKTWVATDTSRAWSQTCTIDGQEVQTGNVYVGYAAFLGSGNNQHTQIWVATLTACGELVRKVKVSESYDRNQGITMEVDPGTGNLWVAWREFVTDPTDKQQEESVLFAMSADGGKSFTKGERIKPLNPATGVPFSLQPFDQIPTPTTFRTFMFPTMAIVPGEADGRPGQPGRVYVAFSSRGFAPIRPGQALGDARIVYTSTIDGVTWTYPRPADPYPGAGSQIQPAWAFSGGKLAAAHYDLREDRAGAWEDLAVEYGQQYWRPCLSVAAGDGSTWFVSFMSCVLTNNYLARRHTIDVRAAIADPVCLREGTCSFSSYSVSGGVSVPSAEVSKYLLGYDSVSDRVVQLQNNRPNLQMFRKGTYPFIGDYFDIRGQDFIPDGQGGYVWNTGFTANRPTPRFHVTWTDNRDVVRPTGTSRSWQDFTPVVQAPTAGLPACEPGQGGIRNQNVYQAALWPGLIVTAPLNNKKVSEFQRTFVVMARNTTTEQRTYAMTATPPEGVTASFDQFSGFGFGSPVTTVTVVIPPRSSVSRTLFVALADPASDPSQVPNVFVPVEVAEVGGGDADVVFLNPDFDSPDFDSPDFDSSEFHSPDFDSPDFDSPDFDSPDFDSYTITAFNSPDFDSPDFDSPDFDSPDFDSPDFDSPDFDSGVFKNPDFDSPDFDSPDFDSAAVSDTTFPVYNTGNTTSAFKANLSVAVDTSDPNVRYQLVVWRTYVSPIAECVPPGSTAPTVGAQNQVLVNIVDPNLSTPPWDANFNDPSRQNASFNLAPGERANVTLRAYCKAGAVCPSLDPSFVNNLSLGIVAQAANCVRCVGAECQGSDFVLGESECNIADGPPRDIYDPIAPTISGPDTAPTAADSDNDGSEPVTFTVTAADNLEVGSVECAGVADLSLTGTSGDQYGFTGTFPVGTTMVTCTAYDTRTLNGLPAPNTAQVTFDVTVDDVSAPVFDADQNVVFTPDLPVDATGPDGAVVYYTNPTASDSNGGAVDVSCASDSGLSSGSMFPIGTTPINCVATDDSGNSSTPTNLFDVVVVDESAPTVTVDGAPAGAVEGNALGGATVTYSASATDVVDDAVAAACEPPSGSTFPIGTTTVTCTATDAFGNTGSTSFDVSVVDTIAPVLTLTGANPLTLEAGTPFADPGATATDTVAGNLTGAIVVSGAVNAGVVGTYTLTYTVSDGYNDTTATRTVSVVDTTAPVLGAATVNPSLLWPPNGEIIPVTATIAVTESGSGVGTITWSVIDEYGTYQPSGTVTVTGSGPFSVQVPLLADRKGNDKDGRHYQIRLTVIDRAGNASVLAQPLVVNVHDQSGE